MSEFQEFLQQQAQAAEAEFNASLKGVISEWEKRSGSIIFNFEDLLDAAKKTIQSDTERIENLLIPFEKNIKTLSESVSVSKTVQALLQEHIQSSNTFGAQLQSSLDEVLHTQNSGIIPQLALHERSINALGAQLKSSLGEVLHVQNTSIIPQLEIHEQSLKALYDTFQENHRQITTLATASEGNYMKLELLIKENNKQLNDMQEQALHFHQESEEKNREAILAVQANLLALSNSNKQNFTMLFIFIFIVTIATIFILYPK